MILAKLFIDLVVGEKDRNCENKLLKLEDLMLLSIKMLC